MNAAVTVLAIPLLLAANAFAASDLDKPIEATRPTIRTEIYRGRNALDVCGIDTSRLLDCVFAIQNKNVQQNTSTDAFNAGLFFSAWLLSYTELEAIKKATGREGTNDAMRFYKSMKEYQSKLRIDNRALCEAARVVCGNVVPIMESWDSKYKGR